MLEQLQLDEQKETRAGFGAGIDELANENQDVVVLTADLGGSLRNPAACCSVASVEPSFGLNPQDGRPGAFKLYDQSHDKLRASNGWYVFGVYRVRGRGVEVLDWEMRHSSKLHSICWHGGGKHRNSQQAKIPIEVLF
jgi:hypothetical protein